MNNSTNVQLQSVNDKAYDVFRCADLITYSNDMTWIEYIAVIGSRVTKFCFDPIDLTIVDGKPWRQMDDGYIGYDEVVDGEKVRHYLHKMVADNYKHTTGEKLPVKHRGVITDNTLDNLIIGKN